MLMSVIPCFAANSQNIFGYELLSDGSVQITEYCAESSTVTVPGTIDGKKVSAIGEDVFSFRSEIKKVVIENGVEKIGKRAFNECTNLKALSLPSSLKEIDESAFYNCTRLESLILPDGLKKLESGAFFGCISIESVSVPSSVEQIGDYVFGSCLALKKAVIENGPKSVGNQMFVDCSALEEVFLPQSVKSIGRKAFLNCSALEEAVLPDELDFVGKDAFSFCINLTVNLPKIKRIDDGAFAGLRFSSDSLIFCEGTEYIGSGAFSSGSFSSVFLPASLEKFEPDAFSSSENTQFVVAKGNKSYQSKNGVVFSKDMKTLIAVPKAYECQDGVFEVEQSVEQIGKSAFYLNETIARVVLPQGIEKICENAFFDCSLLEQIDLPQNLSSIEKGAFASCSSLEEITIPNKIKTIPDSAFSDCYNLSRVNLGSGVEEIDEDAFSSCGELGSITLPASLKKIDTSAFNICPDIQIELEEGGSLVLKDGSLLADSGKTLLAYFGTQSDYIVPDGVEKIGTHAISSKNVSNVTVPSSVKEFEKMSVGYIASFGENPYEVVDNFKIYASNNPQAAAYAKQNDIAVYTAEPKQNAKEIALKSGDSFLFEIDGAVKQNLEFASSDTQVAFVDQSGKVTAKSAGIAEIFAVCANDKFRLVVTVDGGKKQDDFYSQYRAVDESEIEEWSASYLSHNGVSSIAKNDFYSVNLYTSEYYVPIMATIVGGAYEETAKAVYGDDYGQFKQASDNLPGELTKHKLSENTVFYSGTNDIDYITHAGSGIADMVASIGTKHSYAGVISTSVSHGVASSFSLGTNHTVLEFYIDKDTSYGSYIADVSFHPYEYEYLLSRNLCYEVLDAGIHTVSTRNPYSGQSEETVERFVKLKITGNSDNPSDEENSFLKALLKILSAIAGFVTMILKLIAAYI